jgi:integrase
MPRQNHIPKLRHHKPSGRAVCTLNGKDCYCGLWDTPEARQRYDELIAKWIARGRKPDVAESEPELTIETLVRKYDDHIQEHYAQRRNVDKIVSRIRVALTPLVKLFGSTAASEFGPKSLKLVRDAIVAESPMLVTFKYETRNGKREKVIQRRPIEGRRQSLKTVNEKTKAVVAMFQWAEEHELVPGGVLHSLKAVKHLQRGDSLAADPKVVKPVPEADLAATLPHLTPVTRAMVELQALTGMRSAELCSMKTGELDTTGRNWCYTPAIHKTDRFGIERHVWIGPRGQDVLRPFLRSTLDEFIFQPRESEAVRRLSLTTTGRGAKKRKRNPRRSPGEHYMSGSYRRAVERACELAGVPKWTPLQLRHLAATRVRKELGVEAASAILGHQDTAVTQRYAERDATLAQAAMERVG